MTSAATECHIVLQYIFAGYASCSEPAKQGLITAKEDYREAQFSPLFGPLAPGEGCQHVVLQPIVHSNLDQVGVGHNGSLAPSQLPCTQPATQISSY